MIALKGENVARNYVEEPSPNKLTREDWERIRAEREAMPPEERFPQYEKPEPSHAPYHKEFVPYRHLGLGEWVYSPRDYAMKLKKHNAIEVGTEDIRSPKHRGLSAQDIKEMYKGKNNG